VPERPASPGYTVAPLMVVSARARDPMRCPSCDHPNRSDRRFCAKCGGRLGELLCAACGTRNDPDENFCGNCGKPLSGAAGAPSAAARTPGPTAPMHEAERRHLTVMFCDLVSSMTLAERIDDEDLRDIVRRYYDTCAATISRYEGHVANYLGDGLLVYFGYPRAHEDDAERAVRAGLDMLQTLARDLNPTLAAEHGVRFAVRIGVHTGPVVVGDMAGGTGREAMALGETVNLAARLQSVAAPDTVVISGATRRLVRGIFVLEDLGPQDLKGVSAPVVAFRVVQPSGVRSRLDLAEGTLTPFVGRHAELATLLEAWERIQERNGQTILITGEAGVGKSRLLLTLRERLADAPHAWLECRCSPYATATAFHPVITLVERGLAIQIADTANEKVAKPRARAHAHGTPAHPGGATARELPLAPCAGAIPAAPDEP
jgi:class 3 adenylate cyclase